MHQLPMSSQRFAVGCLLMRVSTCAAADAHHSARVAVHLRLPGRGPRAARQPTAAGLVRGHCQDHRCRVRRPAGSRRLTAAGRHQNPHAGAHADVSLHLLHLDCTSIGWLQRTLQVPLQWLAALLLTTMCTASALSAGISGPCQGGVPAVRDCAVDSQVGVCALPCRDAIKGLCTHSPACQAVPHARHAQTSGSLCFCVQVHDAGGRGRVGALVRFHATCGAYNRRSFPPQLRARHLD